MTDALFTVSFSKEVESEIEEIAGRLKQNKFETIRTALRLLKFCTKEKGNKIVVENEKSGVRHEITKL